MDAKLPTTFNARSAAELLASASAYATQEKAASTRRGYRSDWRDFAAWCERVGAVAMPSQPTVAAAYFAHLADSGLSAGTIARRVAAISYAHKLKGLDSPTTVEAVRQVLRGIRRAIGAKPNQKAPATDRAMAAMLAHVPEVLIGVRDRAILLIGFAAALRRSEIVALRIADIEIVPEGMIVHIRSSKTDQEGVGQQVAVPRGGRMRVVEAFEAWRQCLDNVSTMSPGFKGGLNPAEFLFRSINRHGRIGAAALTDRSIADIVKRYAAAAGLDPSTFSGHSLRAGFVTSALEHGADIFKVMDVTRHRTVETLKSYDRRAKAFRDHAGKDFL